MKNLLSVIILLTIGYTSNAQDLKVGDMAPDFNLKNIDGKMVSLQSYSDQKGVIVIFTCNHCPFSVAYEDRIIALDKEYKTKGYPVVAINPNDPISYPSDSFDEMVKRAKEKGFTFPYLLDDKQEIYPQYGATKTPHVFLLKKVADGFEVSYIGAIDNNSKDATAVSEKYLANAIDDLLEGKTPRLTTTKAIGCSIKAKK
jgi:peroxiredoxin